MDFLNLKSVFTIAKKEFLDNVRNKWILIITILFVLLLLLFSYAVGLEQDEIFGDVQATVVGLLAISSFLIPIIAIILGFNTISGEAENGSLYVLLSYPVKRIEVLIGKILGLGSVIAFSTFIGFIIGGIIIAIGSDSTPWLSYFAFIGLTMFIGLIYLNLSILVSSICKSRTRSIGGGIFIFLWTMIYGTIIGIVYYLTTENATEKLQEMSLTGKIPDLFYNSAVFNPGDLYSYAVTKAFDSDVYLGFLNTGNILLFLTIWFIVPAILAYIFFRRRDI
jgi:ABC-type transport system involved in multi-copper enzyme maturation permease subunit